MDAPLFLRGLVRAFARRPAWLAAAAVTLLIALAAALPYFAAAGRLIQHRYAPGSLVRELDETFRIDNRVALEALDGDARAIGSVLALLAMLGGAFCAGGWLELFTRDRRDKELAIFCRGGARWLGRFFRVLLITLIALQFFGWLVYDDPWKNCVLGWIAGVKDVEQFTSEASMRAYAWVQDGVYLCLFALTMAWGDITRTRMALEDSRSAVVSGVWAVWMIVERPLAHLRPAFVLTALEAAILLGAGVVRRGIESALDANASESPVRALILLTVLVVALRAIVRGARYATLVQALRESPSTSSIPSSASATAH